MILTVLALDNEWRKIAFEMSLKNGAAWLLNTINDYGKQMQKGYLYKNIILDHNVEFNELMEKFSQIYEIYLEFYKLPFVIQIGSDFGIVHAEVPLFIDDWKELKEKVDNMHIETMMSLLWGRMRVKSENNKIVSGIKTIYCGHTPLPKAVNFSNHRCIYVGSYKNKSGRLHLEKIEYQNFVNSRL